MLTHLKNLNSIKNILIIAVLLLIGFGVFRMYSKYVLENEILKQIISRLEADSRVAEVLVTGVNYDEQKKKTFTTIKFLEYDSKGKPLEARYYTFTGNIIQFQALVIRFDDIHVRGADKLKGKSAYLFLKVFLLDGKNTVEYPVTEVNEIPAGYKLEGGDNAFEGELWENFWEYALNPDKKGSGGIKNAQIEAPGTMFIPGILYTIRIEHDGGLRIDTNRLSPILRGEKIP